MIRNYGVDHVRQSHSKQHALFIGAASSPHSSLTNFWPWCEVNGLKSSRYKEHKHGQ